MARNMMEPSREDNNVKIVGKVVDITVRQGKTKAGADYISYKGHVRVNQEVNGVMETSDEEIQGYANKYTTKGAPNIGYTAIEKLRNLKTIENVGLDAADIVKINNGVLTDGTYVSSTSKQIVKSRYTDARFIDVGYGTEPEVAQFTGYIFIIDMVDEEDNAGELTGRLLVKAALPRYNGKIGLVEFVAEDPNQIEWLRENWTPKSTVAVRAWLRCTKKERVVPVDENNDGWGGSFAIGGNSPRTVRELVIEKAKTPLDEEFGYDATEMRKAYVLYKSTLEQQMSAPATPAKKQPVTNSTMGWE